jgi:hypothetical protein
LQRKEAAAFDIDTDEPKFGSLEKKIYSSASFSFIGQVLVRTRMKNEPSTFFLATLSSSAQPKHH